MVLRKMTERSAGNNSRRSKNCRVILIDWDDTLCPSTFVDRYQVDNVNNMPAHVREINNSSSLDKTDKAESNLSVFAFVSWTEKEPDSFLTPCSFLLFPITVSKAYE